MDIEHGRGYPRQELPKKSSWNTCLYCRGMRFKELHNFTRHLRSEHCTVEGGSFVCRYGYNSVCNSLPLEGVSDLDYADHIMKQHAFASNSDIRRKQSTSSDTSLTSIASEQNGGVWTMVAASQNLAAVLNDPNRGKQKDFFTKTWGAEFVDSAPPSCSLPEITRSHFETYLRKISKRHRRHEILSSDLPETSQASRSRRARSTALDRSFEPLDVPPIFLQTEFDLSRPTVFHTAFPFAKNGITVDGSFRKNCKILQERLTHSLDQVEMRIAEQVADKSEAFFQAMTSHDSLMEHLAKTLSVVRGLRSKISVVDKNIATEALRLLRLHQRRINHHLVLEKLKLMRTVHQTQPQIQVLLSAPDYVAALELISTTREILDHELAAVHSFRHLGPQLLEITRLIDKMMASEFENYSTRDLNRPLTDDLDVLELDKLVSIMMGMLRRGNTEFITQYQVEAFTAVRALVKQVVLERLAESDCETQGPYNAEQVAALPLDHFVLLMDSVTTQLVRLLRKIKGVHDVIKETIEAAAGLEQSSPSAESDAFSFLSPKDVEKGMTDLNKLLTAVCNFAHEECGKLLSNVTALDAASASQVCRLGQVVERFSKQCAAVYNKSAAALRVAFQVQASRFVTRFHMERRERLTVALESETWRPADVPLPIQKFVSAVVTEGTIPPIVDFLSGKGEAWLIVGDSKFIVIGAVMVVLRLISEYSIVARDLSLLTVNLLRNLTELLNYFNSRSCQLVLGAGALQTAGLKTITTTNLVLTSRAMQLVVSFLPHIRRHFEELLSSSGQKTGKSAGGHLLDEVEINMIDHINQLNAKVVLIVSTVVASELVSWAAKPPVPSQAFRNISRHLTKLNEAVSDVLPSNQIEDLYKKIHEAFKSALRDQLKKLNIVNNGGPQHGTVTSELIFYAEMLKKLNVLPIDVLSEKALADVWMHRQN